jgi:hypothetical protein
VYKRQRYGCFINKIGKIINTAEKGCGAMSLLTAASINRRGRRIPEDKVLQLMDEGWGESKATTVLSGVKLEQMVEKVFPELVPHSKKEVNASLVLFSVWGPDYLMKIPSLEEESDKNRRGRFNHWAVLMGEGIVVDQLFPEVIKSAYEKVDGKNRYEYLGARIDLKL